MQSFRAARALMLGAWLMSGMALPLSAWARSTQDHLVSSEGLLHWPVSWAAGDQANFKIERCRQVTDPIRPIDACLQGRLMIEVLKVSPEGSAQRWTSEMWVEGLSAQVVPDAAARAYRELSALGVELAFDGQGRPTRVLNAPQLRQRLRALHLALPPTRGPGAMGRQPTAAQLAAQVERLLDTDDKLLMLISRDAQLLYAPLDGAFSSEVPQARHATVASPFGTAPFTARMSLLALRDPERPDTFDLQVQEEVDTAQLSAALEQVVKAATPGANAAARSRELTQAASRMGMTRESRYRIDPRSSWARQVSWRQTLNLDGRQRIDRAEFVRVD